MNPVNDILEPLVDRLQATLIGSVPVNASATAVVAADFRTLLKRHTVQDLQRCGDFSISLNALDRYRKRLAEQTTTNVPPAAAAADTDHNDALLSAAQLGAARIDVIARDRIVLHLHRSAIFALLPAIVATGAAYGRPAAKLIDRTVTIDCDAVAGADDDGADTTQLLGALTLTEYRAVLLRRALRRLVDSYSPFTLLASGERGRSGGADAAATTRLLVTHRSTKQRTRNDEDEACASPAVLVMCGVVQEDGKMSQMTADAYLR